MQGRKADRWGRETGLHRLSEQCISTPLFQSVRRNTSLGDAPPNTPVQKGVIMTELVFLIIGCFIGFFACVAIMYIIQLKQ